MAAKYGYIGNNPADSSVFVARQTFSPSGITTTFTFASGYTIGYLDAYLNGSRLIEGQDYIASNGSTIDLVSSATGGDNLELLAYKAFNAVALTNATGNFEVGINLNVVGELTCGDITNVDSIGLITARSGIKVPAGGIDVVGVITATSAIVGTAVTMNSSGVVAGVITATTFVGTVAGTATTAINAQGLTGVPNITVGTVTAGSGTFTNLTVNGTQTIINTTRLEVLDKNIGIGSTSSASDITADRAGITIYGDTEKTLTWERDTGCFEYSEPNKFKGVVETISVGSTYDLGNGKVVLELDVRNATTYTHSLSNGVVGIVSFKDMPSDTGFQNGSTITVLFTQNATGTGNTTDATGIGTNCYVVGYEDGATVTSGISTRALVGSAATVTLSTTANDVDFVSFFIHYTGGNNITPSSYKVYATKNGGFRQGTIGV